MDESENTHVDLSRPVFFCFKASTLERPARQTCAGGMGMR